MRRFLDPPIFASEEQTQRARIFHAVASVTMLVATFFMIIVAFVQPDAIRRDLIALFVVDTSGIALLELSRRGHTRIASMLFVSTIALTLTAIALVQGGIRSPGVTMYFVLALMAGLLLGERAGIWTAVICSVLGFGLVLMEQLGVLPAQAPPLGTVTLWILNCMYLGVTIFLVRLATSAVGEALRRAETELAERRKADLEREESERRQKVLETQLQHSQKMEALGTLAGGIAHDFNNILGSIQGFAQILSDDLKEGTPQHGFVQRVLAACDRGKDVVSQILAFARQGVQGRRVIDLVSTVQECETLLASTLPAPAQFEFSLPQGHVYVSAHAGQISQLVLNLCRNASDALSGRRGRVAVELSCPGDDEISKLAQLQPLPTNHLIGKVHPSRSYACVRVSDNGSGIPPDVLKQIFDPFFTTKGRQRGTGLGLAVVHGVIEAHDGACLVETTPDKGTTFSIYLPITDEKPQAAAATASPLLRGHERVLIVDDEVDITDMLAIGLDRLGYEVVASNDPLEALSAFEEDPAAFDVVIADQLMPALRGMELLRSAKVLRPDVRTVLCSGYSEGAERELVASGAIDLFLPKPTNAGAVAAALRRLFDPVTRPSEPAGPV